MVKYNIYSIPYSINGSEYLNLLHKSIRENPLEDSTFDVKPFSWIKLLFLSFAKDERNIIHIHWETNIYGSKYIFVSLIRMLLKFPGFLLLKLLGIKIVWTVHNLYSHDYLHPRVDALGRFFMWKIADTVVVQQKKFEQSQLLFRPSKKIVFIQHPNFIGVFGPLWSGDKESLRNSYEIKSKEIILLAVGSVRPYKELPTLIDVINSSYKEGINVRLLIAGKASKEYGEIITNKVDNNPAIILRLGFVEMNEMSKLLALSDYSILYYGDSSLNSGPLILSLSYGVPVITRDMPASEIITKENGFVFHDSEELKNILRKLDKVTAFDRDAIIQSSGPDWPTMAIKLNETFRDLWLVK
ncbi:MAG: glycosyltransferase [Minisyncoccia bacterium]